MAATEIEAVVLAHAADFNLARVRVRPALRQIVGASGQCQLLQPRVMQVLVALARDRGATVTQGELIQMCWDGRIVGEDAIHRAISQLRHCASSLGAGSFSIATIAKVGYRLQEDVCAEPPIKFERPGHASPVDVAPTHQSPTVPTIAVLPFASLSPGLDQIYFAEGMVEEIVARLAGFKFLSVVAAGATLTMTGQVTSPREAARQLGVTHLLEGSIRRAGNRVRIGLHLVDAVSEAVVWSDRLEDVMEDLFALQDRVAQRVAGVVFGAVEDADTQKAFRRPTDNLTSYDLYLRALWLFSFSRKREMLDAIELLERAIALDPEFAVALSQSAISYRQVVDHAWVEDPERYRLRGLELAEQALRWGRNDATILSRVAASLPGLEHKFDRAFALVDRAIAVNPNSAFVWLISGSIRVRAGDTDIAAEHLETGMRLDPISSYNTYMRMYLAAARFQQRRFEESLTLFNATTLRLPVSHAILAALHGYLGNEAEARKSLREFREAYDGELSDAVQLWFARPDLQDLLLGGIGKIGGIKAA